MKRIFTKGELEVQNIKIGDIIYEYEYGVGIKSKVISLPIENPEEPGLWRWQSQIESTGEIINYGVNERYSHYGPNLYDYEAYQVKKLIQ